MFRKHLTHSEIENYLDGRLSIRDERAIKTHADTCPQCARHLAEATRQLDTLPQVTKLALGQPEPSSELRHRVRRHLQQAQVAQSRSAFPGRRVGPLLNAAGTLVAIGLLALAAWVILRPVPDDRAPAASPEETPSPGLEAILLATETPTATSLSQTTPISTLNPKAEKSFDSEGIGPTPILPTPSHIATPSPAPTMTPPASKASPSPVIIPATATVTGTTAAMPEPDGLIAFSFFNPGPERQVYEIHLIRPDGSEYRRFPLDGVSEPALSQTQSGRRLAYRAWGAPTEPRSLLSGDLDGATRNRVGGFWEDAQPDWSPVEDRLIFASQREQDRRWRLYTSLGDGREEVDLRLEGRQPSFAPNGQQFVYEGCDLSGNRCGLWVTDLSNPQAARPVLEDTAAVAPDWSPTEEQLIFMADVEGNWDLYLVGVDGDGLRRLTVDDAIDGLPTWSPDGRWLAFLSNRGGDWGIWRLHVESGTLAQLFAFDGGTFSPPHGTPYGVRDWQDEQLSWGR